MKYRDLNIQTQRETPNNSTFCDTGVKFNEADLIGCPIRVRVGEKALKAGMVELKPRKEKENQFISREMIVESVKSFFNNP